MHLVTLIQTLTHFFSVILCSCLCRGGCMCSLMLCLLHTRVDLESPKAGEPLFYCCAGSGGDESHYLLPVAELDTQLSLPGLMHPWAAIVWLCLTALTSLTWVLHPTHPHLVALRALFKPKPELCCGCMRLRPCFLIGLWPNCEGVIWSQHQWLANGTLWPSSNIVAVPGFVSLSAGQVRPWVFLPLCLLQCTGDMLQKAGGAAPEGDPNCDCSWLGLRADLSPLVLGDQFSSVWT